MGNIKEAKSFILNTKIDVPSFWKSKVKEIESKNLLLINY